jgi:hypothetical protein
VLGGIGIGCDVGRGGLWVEEEEEGERRGGDPHELPDRPRQPSKCAEKLPSSGPRLSADAAKTPSTVMPYARFFGE